jgi:chromosome partitioning protein
VSGRGAGAEDDRPPIVGVVNGKGGVGKSMVTMGLLGYAGYIHRRAVGVDTDPQASTHDLTAALTNPGYEVVHVRDPRELAAMPKLRGQDLIVADTAGNVDTEEGKRLVGAVLDEVDFVIIPYDHQPSSVLPSMRSVEFVRARGVPFRVLLTNIDGRGGSAVIEDAWAVLDAAKAPYFRTWLRKWAAWPNSQRDGVPIMRTRGGHATDARRDIAAVYDELTLELGRLRGAGGRRLWLRGGRWRSCCRNNSVPSRRTVTIPRA